MSRINKTLGHLVLFVLVGLITSPAFADLLTTGTPYTEGTTVWEGTAYFPSLYPDNPETEVLAGYVEWVVYAPGDFPFSGYTQPEDEYAYVYQIFNKGLAALSNYSVSIEADSADNIATFSDADNGVTGDVPWNMTISAPGSASWDFDGILQGSNSQGLVFSSSKPPEDYRSIVVNHGEYITAEPVPSPNPNPIPEPGTLVSLLIGLGILCMTTQARRIRRH
jgi:hypothetical protein